MLRTLGVLNFNVLTLNKQTKQKVFFQLHINLVVSSVETFINDNKKQPPNSPKHFVSHISARCFTQMQRVATLTSIIKFN